MQARIIDRTIRVPWAARRGPLFSQRRRAVALKLLIATLALVAPPWLVDVAGASNWPGRIGAAGLGCHPPSNGPIQADNRIQYTWYGSSLSDRGRNATTWVRDNVYNPTVVSTPDASALTSNTDAVVYDQAYTTYCDYNWVFISGLTTCISLNGSNECERHEIRYDENDTHVWMTLDQRRSNACHEYGHGLGLAHREAGCMRTDDQWPTHITDHDRTHLTLLD